MIKTLLVGSLSSLVLLIPTHSSSGGKGDSIVHQANLQKSAQVLNTSLEPLTGLVTALHELKPYGTYLNLYALGNCTSFVASRLPVPQNWGNANTWDNYAHSQGLTVTDVPKVGAIAESDTDYYLGHVAVVKDVSDGIVTVEEMNYSGLGVIDTRIANPGEFVFIYF